MTNTQKLTIRASEIRQRLNEIGGLEGDALTEEVRAEETKLQTEYRDTETKLRAAVAAGDTETRTSGTDTPEVRELRELTGRASAGDIFRAAMEHRATEGATRELQDHYDLGANQVPLIMLAEAGRTEYRAVTPAPGDVGAQQAEIVPYVFPQACAAWLGIDMPTVGAGEAVYPVLTKKLTVNAPAENADADETTGSFSADVLGPARLQASFFYSREDRARFLGMDEALRMNLSDGLGDGLDGRIIAGTNGLLTGANLANHNAAAETTFASYKQNFLYGRVDGRYAGSVEDIRIVMGAESYAHASTVYRSDGNNADAIDAALDVLMQRSAGVKVSAHVPALAASKQNNLIRLGMRRDMVAPIWDGITIVPDEITLIKKGQIMITAIMLHAVKILRADGFYKQQVQTS